MTITVSCPSCATSFPVDPAKIPAKGVKARCSKCANVFRVEKPAQFEASESAAPTPDDVRPAGGAAEAPPAQAAAPDTPGSSHEPSPGGDPVGGFDVGSAPAGGGFGGGATASPPEPEPAGFDAGSSGAGSGFGDGATSDAGDGWVVEREPDREGRDSISVEPMETVESSQDAGYFGGPVDGLETTAPPVPEPAPPAPEPPAVPAPPAAEAPPAPPAEESSPSGVAPDALPTPSTPPPAFQFGKRDPHEKARRLARVLVSDMIMYNPERHTRALEQNTLQADFEDEIEKSWEEYVDQVGDEIAKGTDYFNEALNDILAKGQEVFHGRPGA